MANAGSTEGDLLPRIEKAILRNAKGRNRFDREIPLLIRRAIDEVIDAPRTGRFRLGEVEKTEKTYLGTKIEILLRSFLGFPKGRLLDLSIDGIETDIKNTTGKNWMIPTEAIGHPCILVSEDEVEGLYSFGIFLAREESLTTGGNRDRKKSLSSFGQDKIHWINRNAPYPKNVWEEVDSNLLAKILQPAGGKDRLDVLFRSLQERPISRSMVLAVARQKDAMKRLRKNGGARDSLARDGIALLSGNFDKELIEQLNLPKCRHDEFISFTPKTASQLQMLRKKGHLK
ncbi:MAG: NaeI family type II restriction endonuclease [Terracidiphilus sp.]